METGIQVRQSFVSRWVVGGPGARAMVWETEIVEEEPGRALAWRTIGRSDVRHGGRVELCEATAGRGTVVSVQMSDEAAARGGRSALARVFRDDPETQVLGDLRRFRELAETGHRVRRRGPARGGGKRSESPEEDSE